MVFVEEPSYPYSFQIFRDHGLEIVGVPVDAGGMDVAQLERLLAQHRPKLVYTIPSFHNPTGRVLDRARRDRLIELSREHGFIILADEVYQLLYHGAPPPPSFGTLGAAGNVLLARHVLEDPRAGPAARLDPDDPGTDAAAAARAARW